MQRGQPLQAVQQAVVAVASLQQVFQDGLPLPLHQAVTGTEAESTQKTCPRTRTGVAREQSLQILMRVLFTC